jgi:class 3 adenylate cyclase/tetratricopeptide (TPR) repeat protein
MSVKHHRRIPLVKRCQNCGNENPEGFRFCGSCGVELVDTPPPREVRKTVTVLFCDVTGSTAMGERLDPESTRRVMGRYFDSMREAIERHGGTVEKFIGDAVMAVFGIPVVHEDDALRAVRAASDMRSALSTLNEALERDWGVRIQSRIGVNTGEVVTGDGDSIATGDAVNVAARLEQGAAPGETLIGEPTHRLVRDAVIAEPVAALDAKGKSEPVAAFRLIGLVEGAEFIPRRLDSPLVGRENELAQLQRAYDHAVSERVAYQFTLLGPAGIGKSRLVRELHDRVDAALVAGRCLPYGEGITYWPLAEIEPISSGVDFEANRDEIALQTRRILERLAREQPLVVVFDDLQWAEPTFLDLIDHVTDLSRDAPMLLLCVARPDLLDVRPAWGGGKLNSTTMLLEALTESESGQLVDNLLLSRDPAMRERIATAAEGNPLYLEEMLAMVSENGDSDIAVPPTIQALLAARLDRLGPDERTVVESAAVQGQEFRRDALAALMPSPLADRLGGTLQSLVRKDLIRPTEDEAFRFKHLLLRDAAYDALPKEQRADLHERFADWVEGNVPGLEEILGYHLEQAYHYRSELGPVDDRGAALARRAARLLGIAGRRALGRADMHASTSLLERAIGLLGSEDSEAVALYPELAVAVSERGDLARAEELLRSAEAAGDETTRLTARARRTMIEVGRGVNMATASATLEEVLAQAERIGDPALLAEVLKNSGIVSSWLGDFGAAEALLRRSLDYARQADDPRQIGESIQWWILILLWGPIHVEAALAECRRLADETTDAGRSRILVAEGVLRGLRGEFDEARKLTARGRAIMEELGQTVNSAAISMPIALMEQLAGEPKTAERMLREGREQLIAAGERGYLSSVSGVLAGALCDQGRFDEADPFADESREMGAEDDYTTQMYWRAAKARILTDRGLREEGAELAAEVVELTRGENGFDAQVLLLQMADLLEPDAARAALERAVEASEAKGNLVSAAQARERLAALP